MSADQEGPAGTRGSPLGGAMTSLVLRAWLEPGVLHLRVRVVEILPGRSGRPIAATTSIDEACRAVRNWLETLQARGSSGNGDGAVTREG